jgi:hypothetical protein
LNDPIRGCDVYKNIGCAHIDGFLCDYPNCSILKEYKMNNRIKELADRCFSTLPHEDELEKFAELIVRECVKIADLADENGCEWIGGNILTHFGVEERKDLVCPKCGVDRTLVDELQIECDRLYRIIELNGILK